MSWSLNAEGTKAAVRRILGEQKIYGTPTAEEQAVFDATRAKLIELADGAVDLTDAKAAWLFKAYAGGHGTSVSAMRFESSVIYIE